MFPNRLRIKLNIQRAVWGETAEIKEVWNRKLTSLWFWAPTRWWASRVEVLLSRTASEPWDREVKGQQSTDDFTSWYHFNSITSSDCFSIFESSCNYTFWTLGVSTASQQHNTLKLDAWGNPGGWNWWHQKKNYSLTTKVKILFLQGKNCEDFLMLQWYLEIMTQLKGSMLTGWTAKKTLRTADHQKNPQKLVHHVLFSACWHCGKTVSIQVDTEC